FAFHVSHYLSFDLVPDMEDPGAPDAVEHDATAMRGLILGIRVTGEADPGAAMTSSAENQIPRDIRLLVRAAGNRYGEAEGYAYVIDDGSGSADTVDLPALSHPLLLRRDEPVRITVVNRLRAPTAVHWHGLELQE